jgi:hypothetical protein
VPRLASALAGEADPAVRAAIMDALEAIDAGAPPVVDAHLLALRDPSAEVRRAGASFHGVPADDTVVSSLEKALGDPDEGVRAKVANCLTRVLFQNPTVVPALLKGAADPTQRKAILGALSEYLENISDSAVFSGVHGNLATLKSTLASAIPALTQALSATDNETRAAVYGLLGRVVSFSGLTRDEGIRMAVEPALKTYTKGLEESDPAIRQEVIRRLEAIPVGQKQIVAALQRFLERSDLSSEDRDAASAALEVQNAPPGSATAKRSRGSGGAGLVRLRN